MFSGEGTKVTPSKVMQVSSFIFTLITDTRGKCTEVMWVQTNCANFDEAALIKKLYKLHSSKNLVTHSLQITRLYIIDLFFYYNS